MNGIPREVCESADSVIGRIPLKLQQYFPERVFASMPIENDNEDFVGLKIIVCSDVWEGKLSFRNRNVVTVSSGKSLESLNVNDFNWNNIEKVQ
jgi:hypothetical protein